MDKRKHTPGSWKAGKFCIWAESANRDAVYVAGTKTAIGEDEQHANAMLIASAPRLLAALEALVNDFDKSVITTDPMLIEARAAIAAAVQS